MSKQINSPVLPHVRSKSASRTTRLQSVGMQPLPTAMASLATSLEAAAVAAANFFPVTEPSNILTAGSGTLHTSRLLAASDATPTQQRGPGSEANLIKFPYRLHMPTAQVQMWSLERGSIQMILEMNGARSQQYPVRKVNLKEENGKSCLRVSVGAEMGQMLEKLHMFHQGWMMLDGILVLVAGTSRTRIGPEEKEEEPIVKKTRQRSSSVLQQGSAAALTGPHPASYNLRARSSSQSLLGGKVLVTSPRLPTGDLRQGLDSDSGEGSPSLSMPSTGQPKNTIRPKAGASQAQGDNTMALTGTGATTAKHRSVAVVDQRLKTLAPSAKGVESSEATPAVMRTLMPRPWMTYTRTAGAACVTGAASAEGAKGAAGAEGAAGAAVTSNTEAKAGKAGKSGKAGTGALVVAAVANKEEKGRGVSCAPESCSREEAVGVLVQSSVRASGPMQPLPMPGVDDSLRTQQSTLFKALQSLFTDLPLSAKNYSAVISKVSTWNEQKMSAFFKTTYPTICEKCLESDRASIHTILKSLVVDTE